MKVLILGATGFLGKSILKKFSKNGCEIIATVHNPKNARKIEKYNTLLVSSEKIVEQLPEIQPDIIINAATVYERNDMPISNVFDANLTFPLSVLLASLNLKKVKWLNAATSLEENVNNYSKAKNEFARCGEIFAKAYGITFYSLQLEHFYGANGPDNNFINWLIHNLKNNKPLDLTIGVQHRDFVYIDDVTDAFFYLATKINLNGYINIPIGTGESPQVREVVEYLHEILKSNSETNFGAIPTREREHDAFCDITKCKELGFECKYSWKKGMEKMIEEMKL